MINKEEKYKQEVLDLLIELVGIDENEDREILKKILLENDNYIDEKELITKIIK